MTAPPVAADEVVSTSPADPEHVVARSARALPSIAPTVVATARAAAGGWASLAPAACAARLDAIATAVEEHGDELARLVAQEVGKPIREARTEVSLTASVARFYAQHQQMESGAVIPTDTALSYTYTQPRGVVVAVTPFNFPLAIPGWKLLPALAYGNAVIWKPASTAIGVALRLTELVGEIVGGGVLELVIGGGEVVSALLDEEVDGLTFTGSTAVGLELASAAAARGIPAQCEMGGKNATLVLADADLELAAAACATAAFGYAGQKCTATSRVLVEKTVWDEFLTLLEREARAVTIGDPLDEATAAGPVITATQAEALEQAAGAALSRVGEPLIRVAAPKERGSYVDLRVWGPVDPGDVLAQEELFGPLVAAIPVDGLEHGIAVNNSVPYGLSASVFTQRLDSALRFVRTTKAGMVRVNRTTTGLDYAAPFGGEGRSSFGPRELGTAARDFFTHTRTVWIG